MNIVEQNKRIEWIDILKGIAIISVIVGHRTWISYGIAPAVLKIWIYSFHIPLFFFLSGYTFSIKGNITFGKFLLKKVKTILIPMVFFSIVSILANYGFYSILLKNKGRNPKVIIEGLLGIILQKRSGACSGALWFLACLFVAEIIMYAIVRLAKNNIKIITLLIVISFCIGMAWIKLTNILLPWDVEIAFVAVLFIGFGYLAKQFLSKSNINRWLCLIFFTVNISVALVNFYISKKTAVDMANDIFGNPALFVVSAFSAIMGFVALFKNIKGTKWINYIGRNSLIYYGLCDLMLIIPEIIIYNIIHLNIKAMGNWSVFVGFAIAAIVCICIYPISLFINKKMPFVLGKF